MATSKEFIEFVQDQIMTAGDITSKKMFGEYIIYCNGRPVLLVCDDTVYVKQLPQTTEKFAVHNVTPDTDFPYRGAKEHYILDIENQDLAIDMLKLLAEILPIPKPKKPKVKK